MNFLLVFIGGGLGSVLRFGIGIWMQKSELNLPLATFFSNVIACAVFALVVSGTSAKGSPGSPLQMLILTGFCGGLSTFSTFGYESFLLFKQGLYGYAIGNVVLSVVLCLFLFYQLLK